MNDRNTDDIVRVCLVASALLCGLLVGILVIVGLVGLWVGGGLGGLVGGVAVVWLFVLLVLRVSRWVERRGWL